MKKFCVAKAGPTSDGRFIKPEWLTDIAETYDPNKYTARIFVEHIRGATADSAFFCGGDVVAVEANKNDAGEMCLYAQIAPNDKFKAMNKADQKVFPSIEVLENFAASGKAYLGGLGATDSPASLGTQKFMFSTNSNFAGGITGKNNVFMGEALSIADMIDEPERMDTANEAKLESIFQRVFSNFFGSKPVESAPAETTETAPPATAPASVDHSALLAAAKEFADQLRPIIAEATTGFAQQSELEALAQRLDAAMTEPDSTHQHRQQANGSGATDRPKADF